MNDKLGFPPDSTHSDLAAVAQRRVHRRGLIVGGLTGTGVVVLDVVFDGFHHGHQSKQAHHHLSALGVALLVSILVIVVGLSIYFLRKSWRGNGWFAAPLAMGLPRAQRRSISRAVRRGVPSQDVAARVIETNLAQKMAASYKWSVIVLPVFTVAAFLAFLLVHDGTRWYWGSCGIILLASLPTTVWTGRGANKYLVSIEKDLGDVGM
jgi:hypothetical protein